MNSGGQWRNLPKLQNSCDVNDFYIFRLLIGRKRGSMNLGCHPLHPLLIFARRKFCCSAASRYVCSRVPCVQPRRKLPAAAAAACGSTAPVPRLPLRRISCKRPNQHINDRRNQVDKHRIEILGILQAFRHLIPLVLVVGDRLRGVIRGATSCSVVSADHHYWRSLWTMSLHFPSILHSISEWAWLSIRYPWSALTHSFMCYQWYPKISDREKKGKQVT